MARATRASVRAGTARLEDEPTVPPVTRSTRKRSTSVATTASGSNDEPQSRKNLLNFLPFASTFGASFSASFGAHLPNTGAINGAFFIAQLCNRKTTVTELTRPELEAVVEAFLEQSRADSQRIAALERREIEAASRISQLIDLDNPSNKPPASTSKQTPSRQRKPRDIRRHFSIEVPTQQKLLQDAVDASLHPKISSPRGSPRDIPVAASDEHDPNNIRPAHMATTTTTTEQPSTPRAQQPGPEQQSSENVTSPYLWGFTSIFDSVKKVFGASPTKALLSPRSSPQERSSAQEQSPSGHRANNINQSETDRDLTQIVRKRKAAVAPASERSKKTKVDESSSRFQVPEGSDSGDDTHDGHTAGRMSNQQQEPPRTPAPARPIRFGGLTGPSRRQRQDSPEKRDHAHTVSRRRRSPLRPPLPTVEEESETSSISQADPSNEQKAQSKTPSRGTNTPEPSTQTRRRSVRHGREQREAGTGGSPWADKSARILRPHYFEIKDYDQYMTTEAAEAAIDAMLAIEHAQENGLPTPETSVIPAERLVPKITLANFLPAPSKPKDQKAVDTLKPRELPDKREAVTKAREAERQRILERQKQLKEEQTRMELELQKYETEAEANGEVGKKRKRVNIDELEFIPSRRPGQSNGTYAFLDEFFDCDNSEVEVDESQLELLTAGRPAKRARTESNIFDSGAKDGGAKDGGAKDGGANDGNANNGGNNDGGAKDAESAAAPAASSQAPPATPVAASQPQTVQPSTAADGSPPAPDYMSQALQRKRSQVEKYKPKQSSSLREMQRLSSASSAGGQSPGETLQPNTTGEEAAPVVAPVTTSGNLFPSAASSPSLFAPVAAPTAAPTPTPVSNSDIPAPTAGLFSMPSATETTNIDYTRLDTPFDPAILDADTLAFLNEKPSSDFFFDLPAIPSTTSPDQYTPRSRAGEYTITPEQDEANLARFRKELAEFIKNDQPTA